MLKLQRLATHEFTIISGLYIKKRLAIDFELQVKQGHTLTNQGLEFVVVYWFGLSGQPRHGNNPVSVCICFSSIDKQRPFFWNDGNPYQSLQGWTKLFPFLAQIMKSAPFQHLSPSLLQLCASKQWKKEKTTPLHSCPVSNVDWDFSMKLI